MKEHLLKYGLVTKPCENLGAAKVLGLKTYEKKGVVRWERTELKNEIEPPNLNLMTKRQVFSLCGKLVGHYPVAGWLRVASSFVKRGCQGDAWDSLAGPTATTRLKDVLTQLNSDDPVKGLWSVPPFGRLNIWCDASKIAYAVALEKENEIIEDGAWLQKADDNTHINLAELNAVVKGVNLAMKWNPQDVAIMTDSAAVYSWMSSMQKKDKRIKVSGLSKMLVRRRLSILLETLEAYNVQWNVFLVPTTKNKADDRTRVPKHWLKNSADTVGAVALSANMDLVEHSHSLHHCGVNTTLYFARQIDPEVSRDEADRVVKNCQECQSIDPSAVRMDGGELSVDDDWRRVAMDATHHGQQRYLTIVDCGPSRFAIWRAIRNESDTEIVPMLRQVFSQFGPPAEVLCDNGKSFTSKLMRDFCKLWGVKLIFRCAYKPSGNGIVERNHRTIKRMSARSSRSIEYCVFWYNITPRCDQGIAPARKLLHHEWLNPFLNNESKNDEPHDSIDSEFSVGDKVWVKPPAARCTTFWNPGIVTGINSKYNIEIDGVPRHLRDVRRRWVDDSRREDENFVAIPLQANDPDFTASPEGSEPDEVGTANAELINGYDPVRRSVRQRRFPKRFNDFLIDSDGDIMGECD